MLEVRIGMYELCWVCVFMPNFMSLRHVVSSECCVYCDYVRVSGCMACVRRGDLCCIRCKLLCFMFVCVKMCLHKLCVGLCVFSVFMCACASLYVCACMCVYVRVLTCLCVSM